MPTSTIAAFISLGVLILTQTVLISMYFGALKEGMRNLVKSDNEQDERLKAVEASVSIIKENCNGEMRHLETELKSHINLAGHSNVMERITRLEAKMEKVPANE